MAEPIEVELDVGAFLLGDFGGEGADLAHFEETDAELTDEEWARILGKVVPTPDLLPTGHPADEIIDLASFLVPPHPSSPPTTMANTTMFNTPSLYMPPSSYTSSPLASMTVMSPPSSNASPSTATVSSQTFPSSPESGSESSPQSSPPTAYGEDHNTLHGGFASVASYIAGGLPTSEGANFIDDCAAAMNVESLPMIEPFPPRSPIFEQQAIAGMGLPGNAGVAAGNGVSKHLGQPLAQALLSQHAGIQSQATALADTKDDSKKRRRAAIKDEIAAASSGVVLPRDTLLKLSSAEMESYLHTLKASRQLTHEEERGLKKQLRLIKNREYAQESRKKKKTAHQELEGELNSLRNQNNELRTQNSALQSEVVLLNSKLAAATQENTRLRSALRQMHHFQQQKKNVNNKRPRSTLDDNHSAAPSSPLSWFSLGGTTPQSPKTIAGGVCLLGVVIFALSFLLQGPGMMFGAQRTDIGWSTSRAILQEEETFSYRRWTWVADPPAASVAPSIAPDSSPGGDQQEAKSVAKCGYNNMCYLYSADKSHHIKTVELDPLGAVERHVREIAEESLRHDSNRTAIPVPVN